MGVIKIESFQHRSAIQACGPPRSALDRDCLRWLLCSIGCSSGCKGIDVYTSNNPGAPVLTFKFWRHFFTEFFPANWANAVFWLLASQLVASLTVLLAWIIKRSLSLPAVSGLISDRDVGELATAEGKIHKLDDLVGSSKSLVILINGMELLDEADRLFIEDLLDPPANQRETIRFVHSHNIILVAVHFGSFDRERIVRNSSSIAFDELTIPPFSIEELDAIYKLTCTQTSSGVDMPAISDDLLERLLTDAKGNVHAILASLDREVERQVSGQMRKLCSEDIDGFFGVREFTSCILLRERLGTTNGDPVDLTVNLGHREREHEPLGVATKKDLVDWIVNVVTPFYVQVFGFGLPEQPQRIVNRFAESPIAIAVDQLLGLDESKRHVLMQWLEKSGKEALARAHYFHFCMLYDAASAQGQSDRELSVTRASWHLECLDLLGFGAGSLSRSCQVCRIVTKPDMLIEPSTACFLLLSSGLRRATRRNATTSC